MAAGTFSLFMYVSMILAESLLGRTFGTYVLRPFGMQDSSLWVPVLAVLAIAAAALVNLVGNQWVERSATATAALKIVGIAVLASAGILAAGVSSLAPVVFIIDSVIWPTSTRSNASACLYSSWRSFGAVRTDAGRTARVMTAAA